MQNTLTKVKTTIYTPGSPGFPAYPGQPYVPAHWVNEVVTWTTIEYVTPIQKDVIYPPGSSSSSSSAGQYGLIWLAPYYTNGKLTPGFSQGALGYGDLPNVQMHNGELWWYTINVQSAPVVQKVPTVVTHTAAVQRWVDAQPYIAPIPGQPPIAAQVTVNYNFGWNSSARSIAFLIKDGYVEFKIPGGAAGAVCGLNDVDTGSGYFEIDFAFSASHGILKIVEGGVEKLYVGQYQSTDVLKIERLFGVVTYYVNGDLIYTSLTTAPAVPMFLDASLYTGGDMITDPAIVDYYTAVSAASFLPLRTAAWNTGAHVNQSITTMQPLTSSSRSAYGARNAMEPMIALSADWVYGESVNHFQTMVGFSFGGAGVPSYALCDNMLGLLISGSGGMTGEIGGANASMRCMYSMSSDHNYGDSRAVMAPLEGYAFGLEGNNNATLGTLMYIDGAQSVATDIFVAIDATGVITTIGVVDVLVDQWVQSDIEVETPMSLTSIYGVLMRTLVTASSFAPAFDATASIWSVNYDTSTSTRYENYPFNSFGKYDGRYFGAAEDGIYLLEGDAPQWLADLGKVNFGTDHLSRIADCFIGVASSGTVYVKVTHEGQEYIYASRAYNETMQTQRIDIGRGLRANFFKFALTGNDATELASVQFVAAKMTRRI
jgi:hypothetical protein